MRGGKQREERRRYKQIAREERVYEKQIKKWKQREKKETQHQILCIQEMVDGKPTLSVFVLNLLVSRDGLGGAETFEEPPEGFLGV